MSVIKKLIGQTRFRQERIIGRKARIAKTRLTAHHFLSHKTCKKGISEIRQVFSQLTKMEKASFNKGRGGNHLKKVFQGDQVGANDGVFFPKDLPRSRTPGPQGEDVPISAAPSIFDENEPHLGQGQQDLFDTRSTPPVPRIRRGPGFFTLIGYFTLRIVFILAGLTILLFLGLYSAKLTGIYDPCEVLMVSSEDCVATPYMKGMLYHVECTKNRQCLLPGFSSMVKNEDWSLNGPATEK